jgi:hypothetical protein
MKKLLVVAAVLAWVCVPVHADTLQLRIVSTAGASEVEVDPGTPVDVMIQGQLVAADTAGLALFGVNLTAAGIDLCDTTGFLVEAPAGDMQQFDRNLGLTNPPGPPSEITGFSGTCDGAGGLWQIGGGQNTIGNEGPTVYPVGEVVAGVANGGWQDLAVGTLNAPAAEGEYELVLNTGFANTLDIGGGPDVWPVSAAEVTIVGSLTVVVGTPCHSTAACPNTDVNCDDLTDGFDITTVRSTANWLKAVGDAADPRADVTGDGIIDGFDITAIRSTACWLQ